MKLKSLMVMGLLVVLAGCASPTFQMAPEQIAALSDDELCRYDNNYRAEAKLEAEIAKRQINCDPFYRQCLKQGNQPGTQAMNFCIATLKENEALKQEPVTSPYMFNQGLYGIRR